jgi:outer membrane protein assembly factor BamB
MRMQWVRITAVFFTLALARAEFPDVEPFDGWDSLKPAAAAEGDWPWWRGPGCDSVAPSSVTPPTRWSAGSGTLWQVKLPGLGHSSPILCGDRIYLTTGDQSSGTVSLLCLERQTGRTLWQCEVYKGAVARLHKDNSLASATPAFDGERIFVPYQSDRAVGLAAVSPAGKVLWRSEVVQYTTIQGYSASPVFYKSLVIIPAEASEASRMIALHRESGRVVWRTTLRKVKESYATPLVAHLAGRDQLVLVGGESTRSYNPATGALLWECQGPSTYNGATPAVDADTVYVTGGYPQRALMAIRADGSGDVTQTHIKWQSDKKAGYVPSPVYCEALVYAVNDQGLARCYDAGDGTVLWERKLKGSFYSSPVIAGGMIYFFDRQGVCTILKTGRKLAVVAENTLPSGVFASPVFSGSRMYLRTLGDLYCIERLALD